MDLHGKKALVTGGSEGIGKAIAAAFRAEGMDVSILARTQTTLDAAAAELDVHGVQADVGIETEAVAAMEAFVAHHGRIDVLVNNAGIGRFGPLVDFDLADFEAVHRTNVIGAFLMGREAARHFVKQESGELINVSSTSGLKGGKGGSAYSSSKFALRSLSECWRAELRPHNVRVMHVNPSEVLTGFAGKAGYGQADSPRKLRPQEIADAIVGALKVDSRGFIPEFSVFATNPF